MTKPIRIVSDLGKAKMHTVMHEFKHGTLRSSSGDPVVDRAQAIAIALSEAHRAEQGAGIVAGPLAQKLGRTARELGWKPQQYDQQQLAMGIREELEHTGDAKLARLIAMDHLAGQVLAGKPQTYYSRLQRIESGAWWGGGPLWRAIHITDPTGRSRGTWRGPTKLTKDGATNLLLDTQNSNWNSEVSIYTHENGRWRFGV